METDKTVKIMREIIRSIRLRELFYSKLAEVRNKTSELQQEQNSAKKDSQEKVKTDNNLREGGGGVRKDNNVHESSDRARKDLPQFSREKPVSTDSKPVSPVIGAEHKEESSKLEDKPDIRGHKLDFNA